MNSGRAPAAAKSLFLGALLLLSLLTLALAVILLKDGSRAALLYPLFLPLFLGAYLLQQSPANLHGVKLGLIVFLIFMFLPLRLAAGLSAAEKLILLADFLLGIAGTQAARLFFLNAGQRTESVQKQIQELDLQTKNLAQENRFYQERNRQLKDRIGARQALSSFAREMGVLLEPDAIQKKLIEKVQSAFPGEAAALRTANFTQDPVDRWVFEKRLALLAKDFRNDRRFQEGGAAGPAGSSRWDLRQGGQEFEGTPASVVAAPLLIGRSPMGIIRVDSAQANRFNESDLQQLELYAHLSTLALENAQLFARVNAMAAKDALTSLATHRVFQEKLTEEILRAARYHTPLSLLMLDIDHFKQVNDHYGHPAGDGVLKEVSRVLLLKARNVDFPARYGGEEFVLILPQTDAAEAGALAEELRRTIEAQRISSGGRALNVTVSIGCASFPKDAQISSQLVRTADERLYRAKSAGRNRVVCG